MDRSEFMFCGSSGIARVMLSRAETVPAGKGVGVATAVGAAAGARGAVVAAGADELGADEPGAAAVGTSAAGAAGITVAAGIAGAAGWGAATVGSDAPPQATSKMLARAINPITQPAWIILRGITPP
jgi:hypothetical protein